MKISSKGQITIPRLIREQLGLLPNTDIILKIKGQKIVLYKNEKDTTRGNALIHLLAGKASLRMTTDEIMSLTRQ